MLYKIIAAAALFVTLLPTASKAQSDPWPTNDWVAVCALDAVQTGARVVYAPEPGVYCRFEDYTIRGLGGRLATIDIMQESVDETLTFARFVSALYQNWGLGPPMLEIAPPPDGVPARLFGTGEGYVVNIVPEVLDPSDLEDDSLGIFFSRVATHVDGEIFVRFRPQLGIQLPDQLVFRTYPQPNQRATLAHEVFHAIHFRYVIEGAAPEMWVEQWVREGLSDAMEYTAMAIYDTYGDALLPPTGVNAPLTGMAPHSTHRYTDFDRGLYIRSDSAAYDTSSFWSHLFVEQIGDITRVPDMLAAGIGPDQGAAYVVDDWLRDSLGRSLPEAFRIFLQDVIREGSFYDGALEDELLSCDRHDVVVPNEGTGPRVYQHERRVPETLRARLRGMRVSCFDYVVDASEGSVVVSLASLDADDLSPHLQVFTGDTLLSAGETITLAAGETHTLRVAAFFNPIDRVVSAEELILGDFALRFEQSPQSPCNGQTVALNAIATIETPLGHGAGRADLPEFGEASVEARFGERVISGPACARLIVLDYGNGPALTFQLTHNPTNPYWHNMATQNFTGNWAAINVHIAPDAFEAADFVSGGEVVLDQSIVIGDETSAIVPGWEDYRQQAGYTFVSQFANGWGRETFGTFGHPYNDNLTLSFTDVGQTSASGTFTFNTLGPSSAEFNDVFVTTTATGTFTVPIERMGPREDVEAWRMECQVALEEGRAFDMAMCARALPDGGGAILGTFDIHWEWFAATFLR